MSEKITFTPREFQMDGARFEKRMKKTFKSSEKAWSKFLKPTVNILASLMGMAVGAKAKTLRLVKLLHTL